MERESHFVGDAQDARSTTTADDLPALDDVSSEALVDLATYDLTFDITPYAWIRVDGLMQLRWTANYRDQPTSGENYTHSFTIPRARFAVWAGVTEYLRFRMRFGVSSGGDLNLEQAFADAAIGPFTLRVGRFWLPIYWGGGPAPNLLTKAEYSFTANYLDGGQTHGASLAWGTEHTRLRAFVGDGLRTGFAEFGQQTGADYALTARFDARLLTSHEWSRFDEFSSFRGSDVALRFGAAVHGQQGGETGTTANLDYVIVTADAQLEGDGFHLFAAGGWAHVNVAESIAYDNFALEVQAGYFVLEPLEMWASYDALFADGRPQPLGLGGGTGETDLHTVSAGLTWYIVPRAHRAKLVAQLDYVIGALDTSLIGPSNNNGLLPSTGGNQFIARLQLTTAF
ncbi:MAG: hypothetical protein JRH11_14845 [Deltaproteobacteria bacterium]|nr:hypothetical protein [Deltaproteobacteria bacterium]